MPGHAKADPESLASPPDSVSPFDRRVLIVAGLVFAVLMALSDRYGFHGDELYMLDSARHLEASYVDQPVFAPLMARVSLSLFGLSEPGLRLWPALAAGTTVVIGGLTAREFGGGRRAQLLTAIAVATMPTLLGGGHIANTTSYMVLACAGLALVVARIGRTGDTRWWLAGGVVAGIGTEDNHLVGILAVALTVCALLSGGHRMVRGRWFLAGAVIAVAFLVPDLWWQADHDWATIAMTQSLNHKNGGALNIITWILGQLAITSVAMILVWAAGLRFLWRSGRPLWRTLALAYGLLFVVYALTTGAQVYYLAGVYVCLLAAGAVSLDEWLRVRPARLRRLLAVTAVTTAFAVVTELPVLPPADAAWTDKFGSVSGASIGWPQLVGTVQGVWLSLPPSQRANAVVFTASYAEAAAINELGRGTGLPEAVSGHNTDWWWGPGNPDARTVVVVTTGGKAPASYAASFGRFCTSVRDVATLSNPYGVPNQAWGGHVYLCTGLRQPLGRIWPQLRHYD